MDPIRNCGSENVTGHFSFTQFHKTGRFLNEKQEAVVYESHEEFKPFLKGFGLGRQIEERSGWYSVSKLGPAAYETRLFASSPYGGRPSPKTGPTPIPRHVAPIPQCDSAPGRDDRDLTPYPDLKWVWSAAKIH
ncbi:hypothetical protein Dsin_020601 [Dipteronia sinensis]|uniref:Uncharacterized protein n=1 Tax=Dipteronia sinensis TaxID=43782 RepID=A0AAE0A9S0_9ROSI|nr:hypothetical protein Dsin_020601 [Dipteronia sinensis]